MSKNAYKRAYQKNHCDSAKGSAETGTQNLVF